MAHDLELKMEKRRLLSKEGESYKFPVEKKDPAPTEEQLNFGIAMHELRHRMQYNFKDKLIIFKPDTIVKEDSLLQSVFRLNKEQFEKMPQSLREKGRDEEYIKRRTQGNEFDAQLLEIYSYNQDIKNVQNDLKSFVENIAWLEPTS